MALSRRSDTDLSRRGGYEGLAERAWLRDLAAEQGRGPETAFLKLVYAARGGIGGHRAQLLESFLLAQGVSGSPLSTTFPARIAYTRCDTRRTTARS